jgi:hypothetical protein
MAPGKEIGTLFAMLLESQSRPSYKPSPVVAQVLWIYLQVTIKFSRLGKATDQLVCRGPSPKISLLIY